MRTIEITTTQNVVIQVKLATLVDRIIAFIIDLIIIVILYVVLVSILSSSDIRNDWPYMIVTLVFMLYTLISEMFMAGQTFGKKIVGIKVIKADGGQPDFVDYFRRWALRWIDIFASLGTVAMTSVSTSEKGQRIGDKIADTIVVKKKQQSGYRLKDILGITKSDNYKPQYPEIATVPESNMLTVKRLLLRRQKFPSIDTYQTLVREAGQKFEENLQLNRKEHDYEAFLKQLLKDYVILTR